MIGRCFNPDCGEEMHYLRQGLMYAWESGCAREFRVDFFWLCPTCSRRYQVASDEKGIPVLLPNTLRIWSGRRGCRVRRVFREVLREHAVMGPTKLPTLPSTSTLPKSGDFRTRSSSLKTIS
jgi:uncharacterized protein YbaR (Trm112 family)